MEIKQIIGDKVLGLGDSYWYIDERLIKIYKITICSFQDINKGLFRFNDQVELLDFIKDLQLKHNIVFHNYQDTCETKLSLNKLMRYALMIYSVTHNGLTLEVGKEYSLKRSPIIIKLFVFNKNTMMFEAYSKDHKISFPLDQISEH